MQRSVASFVFVLLMGLSTFAEARMGDRLEGPITLTGTQALGGLAFDADRNELYAIDATND